MSADLRLAPSLDEMRADPVRVADLSPEEARRIASELVTLLTALLARSFSGDAPVSSVKLETPDRLLTAEQAAARLGVTPRWLRDHGEPFRVRLSARRVRYSEARIERRLRRLA